MTRPPFAEFSSLAILELTDWIGGNTLWSERLIALLKELENREARRAKDTGVGYNALWLWRELGIEHLRH